MGITEWVAVLVIFDRVHCLIKRQGNTPYSDWVPAFCSAYFMEPHRRPECLRQMPRW